MYRREISGQFLYFGLTSAISGNVVTSGGTAISGRVSADGGAQAVVAGTISEVGGGQYRLNMFTNDTSGNNIGFLFTASGCVPVNFTIVTDNNVSGRIGIVSGTQVNVWSGQLSGQLVTAASGGFGTASLNSGQSVLVYSGQLSGHQVSVNSGNLSGQQVVTSLALSSGLSVIATLYSGQLVNVNSGNLSGQIATAASGANVVVPSGLFTFASLNSGQLVNVNSGNLSGQFINSHSGANVIVPSGLFTNASLNSGQNVLMYSGQLSGQFVKAAVTHWITSPVIVPNTSGVPAIDVYQWYGVEMSIGPYSDLNTLKSDILSRMASGASVSVVSGNLSGQFINSHSGANVVVSSGLSTIASLYSGQLVNVNSGNLSGQQVVANASVASGSVYLASGSIFTNTFASGVLSDDVPDNILKRSVSGIQSVLALPSLGTTVLKQTSKFNALSGVTYRLDGSTVHMTQTPTTGSGVRPIIQLNVGQ